MSLELARTVADAVLYEGYLLYPYRSSSSKNRARWQWGVLGPPGAAASGLGEDSAMSTQCLVRCGVDGRVTVRLRFLQVQTRSAERVDPHDPTRFEGVPELRAGAQRWTSWDEAVPHEVELDPCLLAELGSGRTLPVHVPGGEDVETLTGEDGRCVGRLVRHRRPLDAVVRMNTTTDGDLATLTVEVENTAAALAGDKDQAIRSSFIGAHLLLTVDLAEFVSLLEPPDDAREAAAACQQRRCWPVLAGVPGQTDVVLASPIILYDYPEVAEQSAGALFDSTEIDEILTLRVMTLTDEEKAAARATDPRAAEIIDRCDQMSPESLQALHGVLRDPHTTVESSSRVDILAFDAATFVPTQFDPEPIEPEPFDPALVTPRPLDAGPDQDRPQLDLDRPLPNLDEVPTFTELVAYADSTDVRNVEPPSFDTGGAPWWDPAADASVRPDADTVLINGVLVAKDSLVRLRPSRRADAQDIFFAGRTARVTAVLCDVDGQVHVAVVVADDPAADMHEWYGRFLYYAPEELEPLDHQLAETASDHGEESRS